MGAIPPLPIKFLVFSALALTFTALVVGSTLTENATSTAPCSFDLLTLNFSCVTQFFGIIGDVLSFNIMGAPLWVRVPLGIIMSAPWVYTIIGIVVGLVP